MNTRPDFALNPMAALVVAYNTVAAVLTVPTVNKFSDKATAVKRLNAVIDLAEEAGYTFSYLPNGAIDKISDPAPAVNPHAASNQLISDAVAANPELAAMVKVDLPVEPTNPGAEPASVGGLTTLELSHRIEVLVENPKRKGSRARMVFDLYRTGATGEEFVQAVIDSGLDRRVALSNLHWDIDHGFIYLGADAGQPRK